MSTKTRAPLKTLNQSAAHVAANAKAEKARKAASKAALKAAIDAQNAATFGAPAPLHDAHVAQAQRMCDEAIANARDESDAIAFRKTLEEDARVVLGDDATDEAVAAYVADQLAPASKDRAKTPYSGPMLALRAARRAYAKAKNGIQCNGDKLATLCGRYKREDTVSALILAMALPGNPYLHLNPGQQSMNLRNKARHQVSNGMLSLAQIEAAYKAIGATTA